MTLADMEVAWCVRLAQPASDYWDSTFTRIAAFFREHAEREKRLDYRAGIIASILANANRKRGSQALKPGDFFPSLAVKRSTAQMDHAQVRDALLGFFGTQSKG